MTLDEQIRALVVGAVRDALPAIRAELGRPKLIPIKSAQVAYRTILDAERRGELRVYRIGHASLVDEADLDAWIKRVGLRADESDEAAQILEFSKARRGARTKP